MAGIEQQDIKREKILDAAYNRFLHYGYSKTTMNEIAGDLSFSKALLYYYFPDKSQLYIAVMRMLAADYIDSLNQRLEKFDTLKDAFIVQIELKHNFIFKNYNFFDFFRVNEQNLPDTIWEIITEIHTVELALLSAAIKRESEKGNIKPLENPEELVDILLDALHGVKVSAQSHKKLMFPQKEHLDEIHAKRLLLLDIFIKGMMY
ncbi:TetR/AcrR family transcriptional regulator [Mucilaginibacter antarcticus]|uniref:TetR/AcrR family transcriptional regulator n=1 Tax=Mucilaginibacter antarcticus TaxID=1855725 RepID=A0ABW5XRE5_9SPHI